MHQLEMLWNLQEKDLAIQEMEKKIADNPRAVALEEARKGLAGLSASRERSAEKLKELRRRQKLLELDLQQIFNERSLLQKQLYGGEIDNVRELETMEKKLQILEKKQGSLEDQILELMESIEEVEAILQEEERQVRDQEQVVAEREKLLEETLAKIRAGVERLRAEREAEAARVENQYLELYSLQSRRHRGRGIARVLNDNCEGCRIFISSAQRGLLYNPSAIVYCENCGRLLVRLQLPEQPGKTTGTGEENKGEKKKRSPKNKGQAAG